MKLNVEYTLKQQAIIRAKFKIQESCMGMELMHDCI